MEAWEDREAWDEKEGWMGGDREEKEMNGWKKGKQGTIKEGKGVTVEIEIEEGMPHFLF